MKSKRKVINPGTVIHTEKPFVHILNSTLRTERCDYCFANKKLLSCSGCKSVHYCGRNCQRSSWPVHKAECANLRRIAPKIVPDAARLLARIIITLRNGGDLIKGYYTQTEYRKFKDLMSHYSDLKEDKKRLDHFTSLCGVLFEFIGEQFLPNSAELLAIYGRMCVNGFSILDPEMSSIGTGIYLGASIVDHSCKPNALAVFEGTTIHIRTLQTVTINNLSEVFISYVDLLNTPEDRQKELQATYYFVCQCSVCTDVNQLKNMHSACCPNPECTNIIDMNNSEDLCSECGRTVTDTFKTDYNSVVEFTRTQLEVMKNMTYLDLCKVCLKKQEGLLHPLNLLHIKTLDLAFESSVQLVCWDDAQDFGIRLLTGFRKYYGTVHPLLGLLNLKIGKILVYKDKSTIAIKYLAEAKNILSITHGETHSLCRDTLMPLMQQASMESALVINHN